jgi:hypothetical protein
MTYKKNFVNTKDRLTKSILKIINIQPEYYYEPLGLGLASIRNTSPLIIYKFLKIDLNTWDILTNTGENVLTSGDGNVLTRYPTCH